MFKFLGLLCLVFFIRFSLDLIKDNIKHKDFIGVWISFAILVSGILFFGSIINHISLQ